jgi:hypothetical protein
MCLPLPNLTGFRARGAKPIGAFGLVREPLPIVTMWPIWLCRRYRIVLPTVTSRDYK